MGTEAMASDQPGGGVGASVDEDPKVGADGISFKGKVNPTIGSLLKRIHQNLGHPPNRELIKHLRLAGSSPALVQAAQQLTCDRNTKARPSKVAHPMIILDFNEVLALDVIWLRTADHGRAIHPALNIVDLASTYQVVVHMPSTKSTVRPRSLMDGYAGLASRSSFWWT